MILHAIALVLSTINGTWSLSTGANHVQLELRWSNGNGSRSDSTQHDVNAGDLGIANALSSNGQHVQFTIHREAGDYAMDGWVGNGKGGGTYEFTPNDTFFADLRKRGFDVPSPEKQITCADLDITRKYVDELAGLGYKLDLDDLITFRALRIDRAYVQGLRSQGIANLDQREVVDFKALDIDGSYIAMLAKNGYARLSARDYINLKALRVDEDYIKDLAAHGLTHLSVEQLVNYKALGIR